MQYRFFFVAGIRGLLPPEDGGIVIDMPQIGGSATYTADREAIPEVVDIRNAAATQLLGGLTGRTVEDRRADLKQRVQLARQKRRANNPSEMLAILQASGEVADFELTHSSELDDFIVCLGDSPAKAIQETHRNHVQSLLSALGLAAPHSTLATKLVECVVFYRDDGKPVFCYELEGHATAYVAAPMTRAIAEQARTFASKLSGESTYADVIRLLSKSMDANNDPLASFLSAWAALEIFVNKTFKPYEKLVFSDPGAGPIPAHPDVIRRIRNVMSDKFRLSDKFAIIAGALGQADVDADLKTFAGLKAVRDKLLHGAEVQTQSLPSETTRTLASKYLRLHLGRA